MWEAVGLGLILIRQWELIHVPSSRLDRQAKVPGAQEAAQENSL